MKAIILAGGFAKRMWPLTKDTPKPLLPVAGRPMIEHVMDKLLDISDIDTIYITTNSKFGQAFSDWLSVHDFPKDVRLVVEDAGSDDEKLGAIRAVKHIIDKEKISDDILCMAGDNVLENSLEPFMQFFRQMGTMVFGLHDMRSGDLCKFGIACLDDEGRVTEFEEKPANPKSNLVSTAIYAIPKESIMLFGEYLSENNNPDAFGHFISWLHAKRPIYGFVFTDRWFDIGSFEGYSEADTYLQQDSLSA